MNDFGANKENLIKANINFSSNNKEQERRSKGRNLLGIADDYVVVDIETTGLDVSCDEIIEVAAARVREGVVIDKFASLIKPEQRINQFIVNLTGITNEMVERAPSSAMALRAFVDFVGDGLVVGHNVNFDINFLYDNCATKIGHIFSNDFLDTMKLSRRLFANEKQHRLTDLINRFGIGSVVEHRALGDVIQTQKCYEYMLCYLLEHNIKMRHLLAYGKSFSRKQGKISRNIFDDMDNLFADW